MPNTSKERSFDEMMVFSLFLPVVETISIDPLRNAFPRKTSYCGYVEVDEGEPCIYLALAR